MSKNNYDIGDIVTLNSHPMAFQPNGAIDSYINQIPPFMCIKEVHVEKRKKIYSDEFSNHKITDKIKYLCVYFNQHRMIFEENFVYQDMLISFEKLTFHRDDEVSEEDHKTLIKETKEYNTANYEYGKRVFFKTYKLEKRKKFKDARNDVRSTTRTTSTHTSPAFNLSGIKLNEKKSVYNPKDGELQVKTAETLYKILWYNAYQEKFSETYLPSEFFTDDSKIYMSLKGNSNSPDIDLKKSEENAGER